MDYALALIVFSCGLIGAMISICAMLGFMEDRWAVRFFSLSSFVFSVIIYVGGTMLRSIA